MLAKQSPHHKPDHPGPFYVLLWFILPVVLIVRFSHCLSHCLPRCLGLEILHYTSGQSHFLTNLEFVGLWQLVTKLLVLSLDIGFVWLLIFKGYVCSPLCQRILWLFYFFEFLLKQERNVLKKKKNQTLLFIWLSFLGFRFSTTGKIVPKRKTV